MKLAEQLRVIAEELIGGRVFVDVTWRVSAEAGTAVEASSATVEAALAAFIAELIEEEPARMARLDVVVEVAAPAARPPAMSAPVNGNGVTSQREGRGPSAKRVGEQNRARIRELHLAGRSGPEIIQATGLAPSCVYGHLKVITAAAEEASTSEAGFRGGE